MIAVTNIIERVIAALDAEGSDRYSFSRDFQPAINYAIEFYVSVFNSAFGENKLSEENLRELVRTRVWQTSQYSRINFSIGDTVEEVWSILAVMPRPTIDGLMLREMYSCLETQFLSLLILRILLTKI